LRKESLLLLSAALHLPLPAAIQTFSFTHNLMLIQNTPARSIVAAANSWACTANSVWESNSKSKPLKKSKHPVAPEPLPACLELESEPIEVQDFLQSVVLEFQWRVGENHASEDSWSFLALSE
jgi:hypothetical protein